MTEAQRYLLENDQEAAQARVPSRLKEARQRLGISQRELARRLGVSLTTLSAWERRRKRVRFPTWLLVALDVLAPRIEDERE